MSDWTQNWLINHTPMPEGYTLVPAGRYTGWRNLGGKGSVKGEHQFYVYLNGYNITGQPRCADDAQAYAQRHYGNTCKKVA